MTGHSFRNEYKSLHTNSITLSEEARLRIEEELSSSTIADEMVSPYSVSSRRGEKKSFRKGWFAIPATGVAVVLACFLVVPLLGPSDPSFTVVAYADDDSILNRGGNEAVYFSPGDYWAVSDATKEHEKWVYTSSLFGLEAENVSWVEATISKGEVYRTFSGTIVSSTGESIPMHYHIENSASPSVRVAVNNERGSTSDMRLGLCMGMSELAANGVLEPSVDNGNEEDILEVFEGETLEISVCFEDGTLIKKKYKLHIEDVDLDIPRYSVFEDGTKLPNPTHAPTLVGTLIEES